VAAGRAGGTAPAGFTAANEVAVAAFRAGALSFPGIAAAIDHALGRWPGGEAASLQDVLHADAWAREVTETFVRG
jgi:1-deoxy-D-xylulose-5-phosphate reductoisomerase